MHGNHTRSWAHRVLKHLGLDDIFSDEWIIAKEDYDFQSKCESFLPFEMGLARLGADKQQSIVVEDTVKNLKIAKDMGLKTAVFHHGKPPVPSPDYIDYSYDNVLEFFDALSAAKIGNYSASG